MDDFPKTLHEFGYAFNERTKKNSFNFHLDNNLTDKLWCVYYYSTGGELRSIDPETGKPGDKPFEFQFMKDNMDYNQRRYEALGEVHI